MFRHQQLCYIRVLSFKQFIGDFELIPALNRPKTRKRQVVIAFKCRVDGASVNFSYKISNFFFALVITT